MEVHAPHGGVHSFKDALVHIGLITIGVLIALSFEGVSTWREHRALAREARENIASELADNRKELVGEIAGMKKATANVAHALAVVERIQKTKTVTDKDSVDLAFGLAILPSVSRTTAEVTGALALMQYEEVKRFSGVYLQQSEYLRMQSETATQITRAISLASVFAEPATATPREFDDLTSYLRLATASLYTQQQFAEQLVKAYDTALGAKHGVH